MFDLFLKNGFVYLNSRFVKTNIGVTNGVISYIGNGFFDAKEVVDVTNRKILPGLIDPNVHFDATTRDDFYSGSKSAAYGGITTIVDFLNPSRNAKELRKSFDEKLKKAERCNVDYHFHACLEDPNGDLEEYVFTMKKLGINTVKLFNTNSGIQDNVVIKMLKLSKKYNFLVLINAEIEKDTILKLCNIAKQTGGNLYLNNFSNGKALEEMMNKYCKSIGKNIFIESCPRYFVFNDSAMKGKNGYLYTCSPSFGDEENRKLLIKYYDCITSIGSDHRAFNKLDKEKYHLIKDAPQGIDGIESSFVIMYKIFGDSVINKMSKNISKMEKFFGKSAIKVGNYADFVILNGCNQTIGKPHGNADYSIFENIIVNTTIESTIVRGKFVLKKRKFIEHKGQLVNCQENIIK